MNDATAHQYALMAQQVYNMRPTIGSIRSAARAVVFGTAVGFRGTDNISTWIADFNTETVKVPQMGEVHEGFWNAFSSVAQKLMAIPQVDVVFGHSEGGALALLFAAELCRAKRPPSIVYAFEPPRVSADPTLATLFKSYGVTLFLSKNGNDIVPDVPNLTHDWQHPGSLSLIGTPAYPFPNITDHFIDRVIKALA